MVPLVRNFLRQQVVELELQLLVFSWQLLDKQLVRKHMMARGREEKKRREAATAPVVTNPPQP
jgi:hypothetical protein